VAAIAVSGWSHRNGRATAHLRTIRQHARRAAARLAPSTLTICGLGCINIGVFEANTIAGWIATGISLLVLEYRIDE
jgi:hypothetical protein